MGNFWDTFVFRVCSGLGENLFPQGYNDAAEVLLFADRLGLLDLATLNDLSILLILMTCPAGSSLEGPVAMEYLRRGLGPHRNWACLGEALPPRLTDFTCLPISGARDGVQWWMASSTPCTCLPSSATCPEQR
jgi:hypothetical protein